MPQNHRAPARMTANASRYPYSQTVQPPAKPACDTEPRKNPARRPRQALPFPSAAHAPPHTIQTAVRDFSLPAAPHKMPVPDHNKPQQKSPAPSIRVTAGKFLPQSIPVHTDASPYPSIKPEASHIPPAGTAVP